MEIITLFWNNFLYIPLFNFLVYLYLNVTNFNLGVAVIVLTILLRLVLIPFTYLIERGKVVSGQLSKDVVQINKDYSNDPVKRKLAIRMLLKKRKVRPWAKAVTLGTQLLILVLLYQVFIDGIRGHKFHVLYPSIGRPPDFINTSFLGFDIGERSLVLAGVVAIYLFIEFVISNWKRSHELTSQEQWYSIFFPALSFLILAVLPSVKSIFILTSLLFSTIVSLITHFIRLNLKKVKKVKAEADQQDIIQ